MPATKPTTQPEWCTTNPTDGTTSQPAIIEPSSTKKQTGFLSLEEPTRQDFNWFMNLLYLWQQYLEELTDGHESNLVEEVSGIGLPSDLTASNIVLKNAQGAKYYDDDFLEGFRILEVDVTPGTDVSVRVSMGNAWVADDAYTRRLRMRSRSYESVSNQDSITKKFLTSGALDSYVFGDGNGGVGQFTSLASASWYHVFAIYNGTEEKWDVGFSQDVAGLDLTIDASGWVRRVASLYYIDNNLGFRSVKQFGDYFSYNNLPNADQLNPACAQEITVIGGPGVITETLPIGDSVPESVDVLAHLKIMTLTYASATSGVVGTLSSLDTTALDSSNDNLSFFADVFANGDAANSLMEKHIAISGADRSLKIFHELNTGGATDVRVYVLGYYDLRGKDWGHGINGQSPNRYFT